MRAEGAQRRLMRLLVLRLRNFPHFSENFATLNETVIDIACFSVTKRLEFLCELWPRLTAVQLGLLEVGVVPSKIIKI